MANEKVSVIIPVYNGADYLSQAVESALNQTYDNVEIIIVNDGSDDDGATREIALSYGNEIQYFEKENGGVASALNYGIEKMTGEYFVWLSHDDLMEAKKIELQIEAIRKSGTPYSISVSNYEFFDEKTNEKVYTQFERFHSLNEIENSVFLLFWGELHFSSLLFHKKYFREIGLFNENLLTSQDNDFIFRLLRGKKIVFVKKSLSRVRLHSQSGTSTKRNEVFKENSKIYLEMLNQLGESEKCELAGLAKSVNDKIYGIVKSMGGIVPEYDDLRQINVMIFGAGGYGRRFNYELNARGKKPICFLDNDVSKAGTIIDGVECRYFSDEIPKEDTKIVVAQKFYEPAIRQLYERNITNYCLKDEYDEVE